MHLHSLSRLIKHCFRSRLHRSGMMDEAERERRFCSLLHLRFLLRCKLLAVLLIKKFLQRDLADSGNRKSIFLSLVMDKKYTGD